MDKVAIIIVTYNNRADINNCLKSVFKQNYQGGFTVFVVDNNSTDETVEIVKENFQKVKLIKNNKNNGYAGGNNLALQKIINENFQYFVILNPDTEVDSDWLSNLVMTTKNNNAGIVQAKVLFANEKFRVNTIGNPLHFLVFSWSGGYKQLSSKYLHDREIPLASGSSMLITKQVIDKIGIFDEKFFMYHEDVDFSWRARLAGYKIFLSANAKVKHNHSFSFGTKKFFYVERNRLIVFFSNYKIFTILLFLPFFILTELAMIIFAFLTGWGKWKIFSYFSLFKFISHIFIKREQIKKVRVLKDKDMLSIMTAMLDFEEMKNPLIKSVYNPLASIYFNLVKLIIFW